MLDIQFIRENPELVQEKSKQKGYEVDTKRILALDIRHRENLSRLQGLQEIRNQLTESIRGRQPSPGEIARGRDIKEKMAKWETSVKESQVALLQALKAIPNMPLDFVPVGASEDENQIVKTVGEPPKFDFTPKHDFELGAQDEFMDKGRAAKIAGARFVYLKGGLVRLQLALMQFTMQTLGDERVIKKLVEENNLSVSTKPFTPVIPPVMLRTEPYEASARLNAEEVTYKLADDDLWLNASAEHTLCTMYWNEILPEDMFPIRYLGYSTSFRREAGTYGKDMEGIFRLHQFDKLEIESFTTAETGVEEHKLHIAIQEYLLQQLKLPYRVVQKCTFDIGKPNAAGVDMDTWFPGQNAYRETHTADYMTDYQARDLKIRVRRNDGKLELVHTADATGFALGRILKAIMENYQTPDGRIKVPEVLRPFMGVDTL